MVDIPSDTNSTVSQSPADLVVKIAHQPRHLQKLAAAYLHLALRPAYFRRTVAAAAPPLSLTSGAALVDADAVLAAPPRRPSAVVRLIRHVSLAANRVQAAIRISEAVNEWRQPSGADLQLFGISSPVPAFDRVRTGPLERMPPDAPMLEEGGAPATHGRWSWGCDPGAERAWHVDPTAHALYRLPRGNRRRDRV